MVHGRLEAWGVWSGLHACGFGRYGAMVYLKNGGVGRTRVNMALLDTVWRALNVWGIHLRYSSMTPAITAGQVRCPCDLAGPHTRVACWALHLQLGPAAQGTGPSQLVPGETPGWSVRPILCKAYRDGLHRCTTGAVPQAGRQWHLTNGTCSSGLVQNGHQQLDKLP